MPSDTPEAIEKKFLGLRDEWKRDSGHHSSSAKLAQHSAYQQIIGMGPAVLPFLFRELENDPDMWFVALRSLTECDPVPDESVGNVTAMAAAWCKWAREQGYQW